MINVTFIITLTYNTEDFYEVSENIYKDFKLRKQPLNIFGFKFHVKCLSFKTIRMLNIDFYT